MVKKRGDSFFGLHFDFHASNKTPDIGKTTTPEMVEEIIIKVRPDFIHTGCKGHPGNSSYPTAVGNRAAMLAPGVDLMKIWRDVTAKHDVALYAHYSGILDKRAVELHPEWARIDENNNPDAEGTTSVFGEYADKLLIPQLIELARDYGLDGVWVDGECWGTRMDYSPVALDLFQQETGIILEKYPVKPGDPYFYEYAQFNREGFRKYVKKYVDKVHAECPGFQITSNWCFSSHMPEPVSIDLDYLSGDFNPEWSVASVRLESRYMAAQGKPWDMMAWAFVCNHETHEMSPKTPLQLMQEAAFPIALGGGFFIYKAQAGNGAIRLWELDDLAKAAEFCRRRESFSFKSETVPQVAMYIGGYDYYRRSATVLERDYTLIREVQGGLFCLLDSQYCVDFVYEHSDYERYPVIVMPELYYLEKSEIQRLTKYVENGGRLIIAGVAAAKHFEDISGVEFDGEIINCENRTVWQDGNIFGVKTDFRRVKPRDAAITSGDQYANIDARSDRYPAATISGFGKGFICLVHLNIFSWYRNVPASSARDFISNVIETVFTDKMVGVKGTKTIDVVLRRKNNNVYIHLINTGGKHNWLVYDEIVPIHDITITFKTETEPKSVKLQPGARPLATRFENGNLIIEVPEVGVHEAVEIEQ